MYMPGENPNFVSDQIITYIGNKRKLLPYIEEQVNHIQAELNKEKIRCLDLFSGSGVVARMLKGHSSLIIANDLEKYSSIINSCYLSNLSEFDCDQYESYLRMILCKANEYPIHNGVIATNYAPADDSNILEGERAFYTHENAVRIDTYRKYIEDIEDVSYKKYFLAPLLYGASVHTNTSGVFKGFYKNSETGIGQFGGNGQNALERILGLIVLQKPVLSNFETDYRVYKEDANKLVNTLDEVDLAYIDPPYNQHPYGSNYFMLNTIIDNRITGNLSRVSGIPDNWNKSAYNKKASALNSLEDVVNNTKCKYMIISYNSEGFISYMQMIKMLKKYGKVTTVEIKYNTFRGSRNLRDRSIHVDEYLFVLKKN